MSVSREDLLKECGQELDVTIIQKIDTTKHGYVPDNGPGCAICGVDFEDHENQTVDYGLKSPDAMLRDLNAYHGLGNSNNCPVCGGSLCVEEYHDCESDRAWRRAH